MYIYIYVSQLKKNLFKHYLCRVVMCEVSDLCFFARLEGEVLQNSDGSNLHVHQSKPHANAVAGAISEGHVYVRIYAVLVRLTEPGSTTVDENNY